MRKPFSEVRKLRPKSNQQTINSMTLFLTIILILKSRSNHCKCVGEWYSWYKNMNELDEVGGDG